MDHNISVDTKLYSKIFRWLGLCTDYYASSPEEDDQAIASDIRKDPSGVLEALIEIRMALIAYKMTNVTHSIEGGHEVKREDLRRMISKFPPNSNQVWWNVWLRYFQIMDDAEWLPMWINVDRTIEELLSEKSDTRKSPSLHDIQ